MRVAQTVILFLLAGSTALWAPQSQAQFRGGFPGGGGMRGGGRDGGADQMGSRRQAMREEAPDQTEVILYEFRQDLKLTPAQEPAWQSYVDKVQALAFDRARDRRRAQAGNAGGAQPSATQQFDHVLDSERNRLTALEEVAAAAKTLYEGLSPEQKVTADSRLARIIPGLAGAMPAYAPEQGRRRNPAQRERD